MGFGIHGELGIWRNKLKTADDIADEMAERLFRDKSLIGGAGTLSAPSPKAYESKSTIRHLIQQDESRRLKLRRVLALIQVHHFH